MREALANDSEQHCDNDDSTRCKAVCMLELEMLSDFSPRDLTHHRDSGEPTRAGQTLILVLHHHVQDTLDGSKDESSMGLN